MNKGYNLRKLYLVANPMACLLRGRIELSAVGVTVLSNEFKVIKDTNFGTTWNSEPWQALAHFWRCLRS